MSVTAWATASPTSFVDMPILRAAWLSIFVPVAVMIAFMTRSAAECRPACSKSMATALIVAHWCRQMGIGSKGEAGVKSEQWDGYSVTYDSPMNAKQSESGSVFVIPEDAMRILDKYAREPVLIDGV